MNSPVVFEISSPVGYGVLSALDYVGRLKDNGENKSCEIVHGQKPDQHLPPGYRKQNHRQGEDVGNVQPFRNDQDDPLSPGGGFLFLQQPFLVVLYQS